MTKELTPLEAWKLIDKSGTIETLCIIETALKRLEEHDKIFKKYDIKDIWLEPALYVIKNHFPMNTEIQLNKLKALEIIKEKRVDCNALIFYLKKHNETEHIDYAFDSYNDYAKDSEKPLLTETEFDALKEILL